VDNAILQTEKTMTNYKKLSNAFEIEKVRSAIFSYVIWICLCTTICSRCFYCENEWILFLYV